MGAKEGGSFQKRRRKRGKVYSLSYVAKSALQFPPPRHFTRGFYLSGLREKKDLPSRKRRCLRQTPAAGGGRKRGFLKNVLS